MKIQIPGIDDFIDEITAGNAELRVGGRLIDPQVEPDVAARAALRLQASLIANYAKQARLKRQPTVAIDLLLQSLHIETLLENESGIADDLGNLGAVYLEVGELDKAEACLKHSLEFRQKLADPEGLAIDRYWWAHLQIKRKRLPEALAVIRQALGEAPPRGSASSSLRELEVWLNKRV
jgi:tetratricopeptide (TPR) repeat protein